MDEGASDFNPIAEGDWDENTQTKDLRQDLK